MYPSYHPKRIVTFRHFARKGWSLFACLHREIRIGVLTAATLLTATERLMASRPHAFFTDEHPSSSLGDTLQLDEADITAMRTDLVALAVRPSTVFTRADLEAAGIVTLNDALKLSAAIDVRQRGAFGVQTDITIDGGTHDGLTLLINGVPIVNPQTGHLSADFPLNLSDILHIEVIPGAVSCIPGARSFSGAVNIVTRRDNSPFETAMDGGSFGTAGIEARTAFRTSRDVYLTASGSFRRSDGATAHSDIKGGKAFFTLGRNGEKFDFHLQTGMTAKAYGANTFYSPAFPDQWEATSRYLVAARIATQGRIRLSTTLSWMRNVDWFQLIHHSNRGENFHRGDVLTVETNGTIDWCGGRSNIGAEICRETILSTNIGHPLKENKKIHISGHHGQYYTCQDERTNEAVFFSHLWTIDDWSVCTGLLLNHNHAVDSKIHLFPSIELAYRPKSNWHFYLSYNRALRLPSFTDLWYKSETQEGNAGLKHEEVDEIRLGTQLRRKTYSLNAKAHYQRGHGMIDWVMLSPDDIYHASSFTLDAYGLGINANLYLASIGRGGHPFHRLFLDYAFLTRHRRSGIDYYKSCYAFEHLRHKFVVRLLHGLIRPALINERPFRRFVSALNVEWTLRMEDRAGAYLLYRDLQPAGLASYGCHALLDLRFSWKRPHITIYTDLSNVTNTRYVDIANVPQPGFSVLAGIRYRLSRK